MQGSPKEAGIARHKSYGRVPSYLRERQVEMAQDFLDKQVSSSPGCRSRAPICISAQRPEQACGMGHRVLPMELAPHAGDSLYKDCSQTGNRLCLIA